MATILLIEDGPGIGRQLTSLLAAAGHRVLRCGGGPTPLAACPLLRQGRCPLPDAAQLLIFACPLGLPLRSLPRHLPAARLPRSPRLRTASPGPGGRRAPTRPGGTGPHRAGGDVHGLSGGAGRCQPAAATPRPSANPIRA